MIFVGNDIFEADDDAVQFTGGVPFLSSLVQEPGFFQGFLPIDLYIGVQVPVIFYFLQIVKDCFFTGNSPIP